MEMSLINITLSGERIREERKRMKLSQIDLATKIGYGGRNELSKCENGKAQLQKHHYKKLCNIFGVRWEYLFGIDNIRTQKEYHKYIFEKFNSYKNIVIGLLEYKGYIIKQSDTIATPPYLQNPTKEEMELFGSYILEITKDNKTECLLLNDVYNLLDDFFTLIEKRKKPHSYIEYVKWETDI